MTDPIAIHPATLDDAEAIADIYGHYVNHSTATFETDAPDAARVAARMQAVTDDGYPWLVARDGQGGVAGFAFANRLMPRKGYRYSCETTIYVRSGAVGRGVGNALLGALLADCALRGFRQAFAVIAGTEEASVVLHARHGYRPCGTLEKAARKHGQWIDIFYMQRSLGDGGNAPPPDEP